MSTILIVLFLVVGVIVATSIALGRTAYEVESARDTEYLELEGTWIRYNIIGGGPPVLLVHGWLSSSRIWEQLAARLAQRVFALERPRDTGGQQHQKRDLGFQRRRRRVRRTGPPRDPQV